MGGGRPNLLRNAHFWQVGLLDIFLSEYPDKSHNFRNFIFMTSHFSTLSALCSLITFAAKKMTGMGIEYSLWVSAGRFETSRAVLWSLSFYQELKEVVYRSYTSPSSDPRMRRKQKFRVFGFKSDTAVLTFTFGFLSPLFFRFSCLVFFFSFCWAFILKGFILVGKNFRILGMKGNVDE